MLKIFSKKFPNDNFPPIIVHILYLLMSVTFCLIYNHIVIGKTDFHTDEYGGIYRVLAGDAIRAIQYRVLVPLIFKAFTFLHIPDIAIFLFIIIVFTYLTILFFYLILNIYFQNRTFNYFIALVLFYPMFWNFMLLNQTFFFMDHSLMFFMTACLYFVLAKKNNWLIITFLFGTLNHPSIGFIILIFLLFNYNRLFKKDTVIYTLLFIAVYLGCFYALKMIYPNFTLERDQDFGLFHFSDTITALKDVPVHLLIRDIALNYGGIHIFAALFLVCGAWKKIKQQYVFIFLVIVPYFILGVLRVGLRLEEMRNWIPLIPFIMILALLYLSQIKNPFFRLSDEISREAIS
jgi:hypothetical protein